ncbi:hypothetical protein Tco_0758079 [Tanacetum coccineum]
MASHRSKSLYAIKECSTCGSLYTKDCCSIGSLNDKILVSESDSSPCCARCGTPVDGPSCRGCAFLRKKFDEDLLAYCVENGIFKDFQDTSKGKEEEKPEFHMTKHDSREEIDEEYERDCEIRIRKLKQDFNELGSEVRKKEQAYKEEKYSAACRYMLSVTCDDEDDYIPLGDIIARNSTSKAITPDLSIGEPDNSLNMRDEHLDTIPATESDEVIKSSVDNLVPIPSCVDFVESLINRDTSIVYSSKIDPILEEFTGELAHIAPIPPGIVEADFDPNDDTSSDNDDFEDIEYVSLEEVNDVDQEEKEFNLEDIFQIQDVILREKLLNVHRLISNIKSLKVNSTPDRVFESLSLFPILVADRRDEKVAQYQLLMLITLLPEVESFLFEIEPDQEGLISIDNSNNTLLELPEFESFHFDLSFPRPPPKPPDVEILEPENNNFDVLNNDESFDPRECENVVFLNVEEDDSFTFTIRTFLPFVTYPESSPLYCSTRSEDTIFDLDIST